jgi:uncharacterized cofD-like protein
MFLVNGMKAQLIKYNRKGTGVYDDEYTETENIVLCPYNQDVSDSIKEADAIVLSMGSVYTSIIPNLICKEVIEAIDSSNAKIIYVCNIMTQPGETDGFKVSDHIKLLNSYLGKRKVEVKIKELTVN